MSVVNVKVRARRNEPVENLIKRFNRKVKREWIIEEVRNRRFYEKPSVKRRREKLKKIRNAQKAERERNTKLDIR